MQDAGVVGLGGAAFPTHVKLAPPPDAKIDTIVINGAECEPYLTTDHRTMVEYPERVHFGVRIMMHALGVQRAVIGVERNKPDAIEALERTRPADLDVTVLPLTVKYPQGAEKMLIQAGARPRGAVGASCRRRVGVDGAERRLGGDARRGVRDRAAARRAHRDGERARRARVRRT